MNPYATFLVGASILLLLLLYVGTAVHKTKRFTGTLLIALAAFASLYTVNALGLKLGIDLQGGSEFIVKLEPGKNADGTARAVTPSDVQQAIAFSKSASTRRVRKTSPAAGRRGPRRDSDARHLPGRDQGRARQDPAGGAFGVPPCAS
jgi:preprotein translocase subunit SecD